MSDQRRWTAFTDEELRELELWYQSAPPSELADDLMDEITEEQAVRQSSKGH